MKKIIDLILKIINVLLYPIGVSVVGKNFLISLSREKNVLESFNEIHTRYEEKDSNSCTCIIFSMDRAIQLHALLSSYYDNTVNPCPVYVLYKTSDRFHNKSYDDVFNIFNTKDITALQESSFENDLISILKNINSGKVFFLVDDIVFIEKIDIKDICIYDPYKFIPSLRLGKNLTYCYTKYSDQKLPDFIKGKFDESGMMFWKWEKGELDWAYPLSVDGHIFSREEIISCIENMSFSSPNSFEGGLQRFNKFYKKRIGICYEKSRIVNIPINKVQNDCSNRSGNIDKNYLLDLWNKGMQVDFKGLYGFNNKDAHQELEISFIKRI
jgi:hypothetical protein